MVDPKNGNGSKIKKAATWTAGGLGVMGIFSWALLEVHNLRVDLTTVSVQYESVAEDYKDAKGQQEKIVTLIGKVDQDAIERHNEVMGKLATVEKTTTETYLSSRLLEKDGQTFARSIDQNRADIIRCCDP